MKIVVVGGGPAGLYFSILARLRSGGQDEVVLAERNGPGTASGFAVTLAWIMSWRLKDPQMPVFGLVTGALGLVIVLLMVQPNLGAAILFSGVWFVLVVLGGVSFRNIAGLIAGGFLGLDGAFRFRSDGTAQRTLEVREVRDGQVVVVSPAPDSF